MQGLNVNIFTLFPSELKRLADQEILKNGPFPPNEVHDRLVSVGIEEDTVDIEAVDDEENNNKLYTENLSNLDEFGAVVEYPDKENEKLFQSEDNWDGTVIVKCEVSSDDSGMESHTTEDRIMRILADYRQEMGYKLEDKPYSRMDTENTSNTTEHDRSAQGHSCIYRPSTGSTSVESLNLTESANFEPLGFTGSANVESINLTEPDNIDPLSVTETANGETLNLNEPANVEPHSLTVTEQANEETLNLTCQDEMFDIKPVMTNSTDQYGDELLNLICQDETPEKKSLFKRLNKYVVIKNGDENFEETRMYADLIDACRLLATDNFTFIKNTEIVRFIQVYDKEIPQIKLAVSIDRDFIVNVAVNGKLLPEDHDLWLHIPKVCLNVEHVKNLLKTLATYQVCIGNPDEELQNVMHFLERSEEESEQKYGAYRDKYIGSTIRSQNCPLLIRRRYERCKNCINYRKCLLKGLQRKNVKTEPSEINWLKSTKSYNLMLESEKIEKLKQMREHITQLEKQIKGLNRENRVLVKKTENPSNNKRNKSTMTGNIATLMTCTGPELAETKKTNSSSVSQQSASHPESILPISGDSCDVTVKDEPTGKEGDIIGVFKTQSGASKPVIIKIINDKKKTLGPATSSINIAEMDYQSAKKNDRTVGKATGEIDAVLIEDVDKLDTLESSLELKRVESKAEKLQNNQGQVCKICNKVVKKMRTHMIIHRPVKRFKCSICEKSFHRKSSLEIHASVHTGVKAHKCSICNQSFFCLSNLKRHHLRIHTGVRPYKCSYCAKGFSTNYSRQNHEQTVHLGLKPFACKICSMMFKDRSSLRYHELKHEQLGPSDPKAGQHMCDQCGRSYKTKLSLYSHKYLHKTKKEKSLACDMCDMKFAWPGLLHHHKQKKHYGIEESQNYICHICGMCFYDKRTVEQHQVVHSDEKPFKCSQCSASFKRPHHLQSHENTHSGVKPYKCKTCFKSFSIKYDMETHELNMHQGKRDFVCSVCSKTFVRDKLLKSHMKIHGGDQFHECHHCNKRFIRLSALEKHKLTHSNVGGTTELL